MKSFRLLPVTVAAVVLAACGKVAPLRPAEGQPLPVKPAMATRTPDAEDLLTPPTYARPERVDELMTRSRPREPDRFDLPPPTGQAPEVPATDEPPEDETRVTEPQ